MKKTITLSFTLGMALLGLLNSNASGPAHNGNGNLTGGPGSSGTCTGCHSNSMGTTQMEIEILHKADQTPVTGSYVPHQDYIVRIIGSHVALTRFGFQLMAIGADQSDAGHFSGLGNDLHQITIGGQTLVEHHHPLTADPQGEIARFDWQAPGPGSGTVSFHGILNAVNLDNAPSGDAVSSPESISLSEASTYISGQQKANPSFSLFPNPAKNRIHWQSRRPLTSGQVQVFNLQGQLQHSFTLPQGTMEADLDIRHWAPGYYFLQYRTDQGTERASFLKQG